MRVILFSSVQSPILMPLLKAGLSVVGVVAYGIEAANCAEHSRGFGQRLKQLAKRYAETPVSFAQKRRIPVYHASSMDDSTLDKWLQNIEHDVLLVYCVPIMPLNLFSHSRFAINFHPSFLPAYRGGHPLLWAVWDGCETAGCTVHLLDASVDAGAIIAQESFAIPRGINETDLERMAEIDVGVPLIFEAIKRLGNGDELIPQPKKSPTVYARRRCNDQVWKDIPFEQWSVEQLWRVLRFTGVAPFASLLEPEGMREWLVGDVEMRSGEGEPGSLQHDRQGFYVSHRLGRIRLRRQFRLRRVAKWLLRI